MIQTKTKTKTETKIETETKTKTETEKKKKTKTKTNSQNIIKKQEKKNTILYCTIQSQLRRHLREQKYSTTKKGDLQIQSEFQKQKLKRSYSNVYKKYKLFEELIETEFSYITSIQQMISISKSLKKEDILNKVQAKEIFGGLKAILQFNQIFYKELFVLFKSWNCNCVLYVKLSKLIPYMGVYVPYINNYEQKFELIQRHKSKCENFKKFLKQVPQQTNNLSLESLLIMPVQRLPRYVLLMKQIAQISSGNERAELFKIVKTIKSMTHKINNKKKEHSRIMNLIEIEQKITGKNKISLIKPCRYFIKQLKLNFFLSKIPTECVLLLFSDVLVICSIEKSYMFHLHENYHLQLIVNLFKIQDVSDLHLINNNYEWYFKTDVAMFHFMITNSKECLNKTNTFITKLINAIQETKKGTNSRIAFQNNHKKNKRTNINYTYSTNNIDLKPRDENLILKIKQAKSFSIRTENKLKPKYTLSYKKKHKQKQRKSPKIIQNTKKKQKTKKKKNTKENERIIKHKVEKENNSDEFGDWEFC
ncbi:faciogenital dysplasia protein [Anaeramoeba flamelloides]|uniref:Faciogenital dysplasia protein n=1 Tax=Anaeramoeba flamelloides TaxID=1746091 RepID=A0AAV7YYP9_9EUKA|nr:faciogenital dysplasia protein [Anaeramoeba flamelloides]